MHSRFKQWLSKQKYTYYDLYPQYPHTPILMVDTNEEYCSRWGYLVLSQNLKHSTFIKGDYEI